MSDQQDITLMLEKRDVVGKGLKRLRREGTIPAVIHNEGKDSIIVSGTAINLNKAFEQAGKHHPVNLKVGSDNYFAIIKDVDFDPKKHLLRHVVFGIINRNEKVETEVPIRIEGEIPAERASLIVVNTMDHVVIEALPKNLVDVIEISGETLAEVGDKLQVSDLPVPEGVTILTEPEQTLAVVEMPRSQLAEEAEEETAEGEEAAAEGEEKPETKEGKKENKEAAEEE